MASYVTPLNGYLLPTDDEIQRLGGAAKIDPDKAIEDAVRLASQSDAVIVVAGLTPEWESEGFDRPSLDLPGRQDELIMRVGRVNASTTVVVQSVSACPFFAILSLRFAHVAYPSNCRALR